MPVISCDDELVRINVFNLFYSLCNVSVTIRAVIIVINIKFATRPEGVSKYSAGNPDRLTDGTLANHSQ